MTSYRLAVPLRLTVVVFAVLALRGSLLAQQTSAPLDSAAAAAESSSSPTFHAGIDLVSRYLWRGKLWSNVANFQPHASLSWKSFVFGTWGSYSVEKYQEQDLTLTFSHGLGSAGSFVGSLNDYFYPSDGGQFAKPFNYSGVKNGVGTGAHTLELMGSYTAPKVPLTFTLGWNFYNDPDQAKYGEIAANQSFHGFDLSAAAGWALNTNAYYAATKGDLVNLTASVRRAITLHPPYSFYIGAYVVRNPVLGKTYPLFMICVRVCGS